MIYSKEVTKIVDIFVCDECGKERECNINSGYLVISGKLLCTECLFKQNFTFEKIRNDNKSGGILDLDK